MSGELELLDRAQINRGSIYIEREAKTKRIKLITIPCKSLDAAFAVIINYWTDHGPERLINKKDLESLSPEDIRNGGTQITIDDMRTNILYDPNPPNIDFPIIAWIGGNNVPLDDKSVNWLTRNNLLS